MFEYEDFTAESEETLVGEDLFLGDDSQEAWEWATEDDGIEIRL